MAYTVKFGWKTISWNDGKFSGDEELINKIREYGNRIRKSGNGVLLDGSLIASGDFDFESNEYTSFALLQKIGRFTFVKGKRPTWENLTGKKYSKEIN